MFETPLGNTTLPDNADNTCVLCVNAGFSEFWPGALVSLMIKWRSGVQWGAAGPLGCGNNFACVSPAGCDSALGDRAMVCEGT